MLIRKKSYRRKNGFMNFTAIIKTVDKHHLKKTVKTKEDRIEKGNGDLFTAADGESGSPSAVYHTKSSVLAFWMSSP